MGSERDEAREKAIKPFVDDFISTHKNYRGSMTKIDAFRLGARAGWDARDAQDVDELVDIEASQNRAKAMAFMMYHARRCPDCKIPQFTTDAQGNHKCDCGRCFTNDTALPSFASIETRAAKDVDENGSLPCPHCGSRVVAPGHNRDGWKVSCLTCDAGDRHESKDVAIEAWNRRPQTADAPGENR